MKTEDQKTENTWGETEPWKGLLKQSMERKEANEAISKKYLGKCYRRGGKDSCYFYFTSINEYGLLNYVSIQNPRMLYYGEQMISAWKMHGHVEIPKNEFDESFKLVMDRINEIPNDELDELFKLMMDKANEIMN